MHSSNFFSIVPALALLQTSIATDGDYMSNMMPQMGQGDKQMEVSYNGQVCDSSKWYAKEDVQNTPTFNMKQAVSSEEKSKYAIAMVDVTCMQKPTISYFQSDFQIQETNIVSQTSAQVPYAAPGSNEKKKGKRKYSYMMYKQNGDVQKKDMKAGDAIDVSQIQSQFAFQSITSVSSVQVDLGGEVVCEENNAPAAPPAYSPPSYDNAPAPAPAPVYQPMSYAPAPSMQTEAAQAPAPMYSAQPTYAAAPQPAAPYPMWGATGMGYAGAAAPTSNSFVAPAQPPAQPAPAPFQGGASAGVESPTKVLVSAAAILSLLGVIIAF